MRRLQVITPLLLGFALAAPAPAAHAQIGIGLSITIAPPVLPVYVQPPLPAPGYIWTPGYWAYGPDGYYWVPGTWVQPPSIGLLWTPGYWGWNNGVYAWNGGYWGPHIGFYGGVNYGFGYGGVGYQGGRWNNGAFAYNSTVNNFGGTHITNIYNETVINNNTSRVAYNGGTGGLAVRPTPQEEAVVHEQHVAPTSLQTEHEHTAASNPQLRYTANHGVPPIAATARPGEFTGHGVVGARPAVTPAAVGAHGPTPAVHGPATNAAAHPGAVTPHAATSGPPHPVGPTTARPVAPAAAHPVAPAPHPAPHPAGPTTARPATPTATHATAPRPPAPHAAPPPKAPPKQEEHKQP